MDVSTVAASRAVAGPQGTADAAAASHAAPAALPAHDAPTLLETVAKLFGKPVEPVSAGLSVSYRVSHDPNEIVTVFSDPDTGKEVAQFPAEIVVQVAQFFDKHAGVMLDSSV